MRQDAACRAHHIRKCAHNYFYEVLLAERAEYTAEQSCAVRSTIVQTRRATAETTKPREAGAGLCWLIYVNAGRDPVLVCISLGCAALTPTLNLTANQLLGVKVITTFRSTWYHQRTILESLPSLFAIFWYRSSDEL